MAGHIRKSREKFMLDLYHQGERVRIFTDQKGNPLVTEHQALLLQAHISYLIEQGNFNPKDFIKKELKAAYFENYVATWVERQERRVEQGQIAGEYLRASKSYLGNYLVPHFRGKTMQSIRESHIEDLSLFLPKHLSAKTRANIMALLHKILADAHRRQDIPRVPHFPKVDVPEAEIRWIRQDEQAALLANVTCPVRRAFFTFLMETGCRHGEARALRWERVDLKQKVAVIAAAMDAKVYKAHTKEKNVRVLPLTDRAVEVLKSLPRSLNGFVFTLNGEPLNQKTVWKTWRRAAAAAGVIVAPYQGTRHSLASQLVNDGVPENLIRDVLGHKTPDMVKRYAKVKVDTLRAVLDKRSANVR